MKRPTKTAPLWVLVLITPFLLWEWWCNAVDQWSPRTQGFFMGLLSAIGAISCLCFMAMFG